MPTKELQFRLLPHPEFPKKGDLVRFKDGTVKELDSTPEFDIDADVVLPHLLMKGMIVATPMEFNNAHLKAIKDGRLKDCDMVKVKYEKDTDSFPLLKFGKVVILPIKEELYDKETVVNAMHLFHIQHRGNLVSKDKIRDWFNEHVNANML